MGTEEVRFSLQWCWRWIVSGLRRTPQLWFPVHRPLTWIRLNLLLLIVYSKFQTWKWINVSAVCITKDALFPFVKRETYESLSMKSMKVKSVPFLMYIINTVAVWSTRKRTGCLTTQMWFVREALEGTVKGKTISFAHMFIYTYLL